jgi:two-component system LytT family response regulator
MKTHTIKSLIIDDDLLIRNLLRKKLNEYLPELNTSSIASSGSEALKKIKTIQPDLIFLKVELDDMTGFEMLAQLNEINFQTIIISSYSQYAIKAIRFNAFDFLVKPINLKELQQAINRYRTFVKRNKAIEQNGNVEPRLVLHTQEGDLQLILRNIIRIEGERNYSFIYLKNQKKILSTKTLGDLEYILSQKGFFRSHKSHLINSTHIQNYLNSSLVMLSDGSSIPIARRKKDDFKNWWESFQ